MMVYAIREPHAFEISVESAKLVVIVIDSEILNDNLQCASDEKVELAKLVECDITSVESGLSQTVDEALLRKRQLLKPVETVSEQLYVGETLAGITKI